LRGSSAREAIKLDTGTSNITLYHNIITKSERYFGENLFASGIDASQSDGNNTFENNIITDSGYGIQAGGNNTFTGNTIANNIVSIKVSGNNNRVTQNNFIYNGVDAEQSSYMNISFANNIWDGNFWATYKGVEKDKTGLGSTPYVENIPFPRPGEPSPQVQEPVIDKVPSIVPISKT
jgi:nitrous oxidase accessory protein